MKFTLSVTLLLATLLTVHAGPPCSPFPPPCNSPNVLKFENGCYFCVPRFNQGMKGDWR
ncbi:hypothetical protein K443DRAFT_682310 [Laccaria amethystina LaAM-08-1]|uniref:Uncharacterized protein n=1 Tax=Laccaria amethystina LaAM-08-1 TaxID=1095629 RepID=A0A0C9X5D1_9AGAR|nr:hypothetical protein K443DRAFT_682310 [Laccaria amethystina LaAM-08-1]